MLQINLQQAQSGYLRVLILINSQGNVHNSLHALQANQPYTSYTMNVNGLIYLNEGDYISVYVFTQADSSYYITTNSGFSGYYIGTLYSHFGFASDLGRSVVRRATGWYEIPSWSTTSYAYLFVSGSGWNNGQGRFTAPCNGLYYAAANIRLDQANGKRTLVFCCCFVIGKTTCASGIKACFQSGQDIFTSELRKMGCSHQGRKKKLHLGCLRFYFQKCSWEF